jgi:enediyne biosynthesis protein E5
MERPNPSTPANPQLVALRRFAVAITVLNVLGHSVLGFEQAWMHPVVALAAAYGTELLLLGVGNFLSRRRPLIPTKVKDLITFLLPAHISGLAVAMLLYPNKNFVVIAFAAAVAVGSKAVFRAPDGAGRSRHFLNPSNFGITTTLLLFPWVGVVPPYHFTENVPLELWWVLPLVMTCTGSLLNYKLTRRHPLILGWLGGFAVQALARSWHQDVRLDDTTFPAALAPMTGVAFILFTFYMVTDPKTTPEGPRAQVIFGAGVAVIYGWLVASRGVFAMFFALTTVCFLRGCWLWTAALCRELKQVAVPLRKRRLSAKMEEAEPGLGIIEPLVTGPAQAADAKTSAPP